MDASETPYLTLAEARALIDREIAKPREFNQAAAVVVIDGGGNIVSISRLDDAPVASIHVARAKAYLAAVQGRPTDTFVEVAKEAPDTTAAYPLLLAHEPFPGRGGVPIFKHGRPVGGIATEELPLSEATGPRLPVTLHEARKYADRAIAEAEGVGSPIGVAIVDELGRLVQVDRMDDSPLASCDLAAAKAMTALKFRRPTTTLTEEFRGHSARLRAIEKLVGFTLLAMGGGVPIEKDGRLVGAIGVSGSGGGPRRDEANRVNDSDIATAALAGH